MRNAIINRKIQCHSMAIFVLISLLAVAPLLLEPCLADPIFTSEISARGQREHLVRVNRWGWYHVEARSAEGVSVEIVDKLRGAFGRDGEAGGRDGRLALFLEAGDYKVFTVGPDDARGNLTLTVTGFPYDGLSDNDPTTAGAPKSRAVEHPYLAPFVQTSAELGKAEARAWWVFVPRDTLVYINAAGRHLGNLAVFRGGEWLVARGSSFTNANIPEKSLNGYRVAKRLERGKHLIVAYGGGKDRYTVDDDASPLHISWMLEEVGLPRRISGRINGSGTNEYLVVPRSAYLAIESSDKLIIKRGTIKHGDRSDNADVVMSLGADTLAGLSPTYFAWAVGFKAPARGSQWLISINGKPGSDFRITPLDTIPGVCNYTPKESGEHQLFTLHSGIITGYGASIGADDSNIGASGVLVDLKDSSIVALRADTVSYSRRLCRHFSLSRETTSYLWVDSAGMYTFAPGGSADYEWRVKRFFVTPPKNYKQPQKMKGQSDIMLDRGLHVMEFYPSDEWDAAFTIFSKSADKKIVEKIKPEAPRPSISLKPINLVKGRNYRFYLNQQLPDLASIHIEKHPAPKEDRVVYITGNDAEREEPGTSKAIELKLGAAQYADMPKKGFRMYGFTVDEPGIYKIETTGRLHAKLTVRDRVNNILAQQSGNGAGRNALVAEFFLPGRYMVMAECLGESAGRMGIVFGRGDLTAGGQLQFGIDRRASLPAFGAAAYDFAAREDGIYRFSSFGPWGDFETRLEGSDGWPVSVNKNENEDEDENSNRPLVVELKKGTYRLYSLPRVHETERMTRVEQIRKRAKISGFGPHAININEPVAALWIDRDDAAGANNVSTDMDGIDANPIGKSARFLFEVAAPIDAKIMLSPDFLGVIKPQDKDTVLMKISGSRETFLQMGKYEIAVTPVRVQNYAPYELSITTNDLFAGISYDIDTVRTFLVPVGEGDRRRLQFRPPPATRTFRVRVGESGVYEIFSQGRSEVTARLYRDEGKDALSSQQDLLTTEIARDGGDPQNWNFAITEKLEPGTYQLQLFSDKKRLTSTKILMRRMDDTLVQAIRVDVKDGVRERKVSLAGKMAVVPLKISSGDVLTVKASGASRLFCALEASSGDASSINVEALTVGRRQGKRIKMSAPIDKGASYALKIWLEGRAGGDVDIEVNTSEALPLTLQKALGGVGGTAVKESNNTVFYRIDGMDERGPGHYELITTQNTVDRALGAIGASEIFEHERESLMSSAGKQLWVKAVFKSPGKYHFVLNPALVTDIREMMERNKRKFETSDKYRLSKNQIKYPEREELPVAVRPGLDRVFEIDAPIQKFGLVTFAMDQGQPIAGLSASSNDENADFARNGMFVRGGQYICERVCMTAVIPGDTGRIIGWNALGSVEDVHGSFTMRNYAPEKVDTLRVGRTVWRAKSTLAKEYHIEANKGRTVIIKLSPQTGALYVSPSGGRDMYYGGESGAQHAIEPNGGRLFLFGRVDDGNAGNINNIELEVYASHSPISMSDARRWSRANELSAGGEIARQFTVDTKETVRINGDPSPARQRLFWSGAIESVDWINRSGQMISGLKKGTTQGMTAIDGGGGILLVNYAAGRGKIGLCAGGDNIDEFALNECRWGGPVKRWGEAPAIREMSKLKMTDGANWYSIELPESTHVSLNAPKVPAAVAVVLTNGKVRNYEEFWDELSVDIPLPPGKYALGIKPAVAGGTLAGAPLAAGFYPVPLLTEDSPLDLYVTSGQKRLVRFDIPKRNKVGIGVRTGGEAVEAALLDNNGFGIDRGQQIFTELDKGTYYVQLSIPPSSSAFVGTDVKLHLFGQNNPPRDPPSEFVKWITGGGVGERPGGRR